jgi:hypothetical protein
MLEVVTSFATLLQLRNLALHEVEQSMLLRYALKLSNYFVRSVSVATFIEVVDDVV